MVDYLIEILRSKAFALNVNFFGTFSIYLAVLAAIVLAVRTKKIKYESNFFFYALYLYFLSTIQLVILILGTVLHLPNILIINIGWIIMIASVSYIMFKWQRIKTKIAFTISIILSIAATIIILAFGDWWASNIEVVAFNCIVVFAIALTTMPNISISIHKDSGLKDKNLRADYRFWGIGYFMMSSIGYVITFGIYDLSMFDSILFMGIINSITNLIYFWSILCYLKRVTY